jgi:phosphatidylglycerol:prolipoprotein diacylglycerol transferase
MTLPFFQPPPIEIPLPSGLWLPVVGYLPDHFNIYPFGILVATAVYVGIRVAEWKARRDGLDLQTLGELGFSILVGGFVCGHVLDAVFYHWDEVVRDPWFLLRLWAGLSSFGGFVGGILGGLWWAWRNQESFVRWADPIAFGFPFGWVFGRMGCTMARDHPGAITDFPLAFEPYVIAGAPPPYPARHDLGFYEMLWAIGVAGLFLFLARKPRVRGFYLAALPILYAPVRFGLDFLRATDISYGDNRFFGLTPGHYAAVAFGALGVWMWFQVRNNEVVAIAGPEGAAAGDEEDAERE